MALELFYVYSPPNSKTSIELVQRKHLYIKKLDTYSVGKLALHIWNEEWDPYLFKIVECGNIILSKLSILINKDPTKRPLLAHVLNIFTFPLYKMEL